MVERVQLPGDVAGLEAPAQVDPNAGNVGAPVDTGASDRPAWLPENFKTPEDLAKAFKDTQAALTQSRQELASLKKTPDQGTPAALTDTDRQTNTNPNDLGITPEQAKQAQAIDFSEFSNEFSTTGDVTPENRAKAAEMVEHIFGDRAPDIVNYYIEGQKALAGNYANQVKNLAGGPDQYASMVKWAAGNLPPAEVAAFNKVIDSGDFAQVSLAVSGLSAKYTAANGVAPKLINGDGPVNTQGGYASRHEMVAAMGDPRYGKDPAYTKMVEQKTMMSSF